MTLSRDEIVSVMTFCSPKILYKILPKTGKLRHHSTQMLDDYRSIWQTILDYRASILLKKKTICSTNELVESLIDTDGYRNGINFKDSIYYDKRVESIFVFNCAGGRSIFLPKKLGKILTEKSYEYYASMSVRLMLNLWLIPWIHDCYHSVDLLSSESKKVIDFTYRVIAKKDSKIVDTKLQLAAICKYLYAIISYLTVGTNYHLSNGMKRKIRLISLIAYASWYMIV